MLLVAVEGAADGCDDGPPLGEALFCFVGTNDDSALGAVLCVIDGVALEMSLGDSEGRPVGAVLGLEVGFSVGTVEWAGEGAKEEDRLGSLEG